MKNLFLIIFLILPLALFASDTTHVELNPVVQPGIMCRMLYRYPAPVVNIVEPCKFKYDIWSDCGVAGWQSRDYVKVSGNNNCLPPFDSIQRKCYNGINVRAFYYDTNSNSIYINCNLPGEIVVTNVQGSIFKRFFYKQNGEFIKMPYLQSDKYLAVTYGRSFIFCK